ncbi:hypothetical protein BN1723_019157, partial [Verticillium longisporum]
VRGRPVSRHCSWRRSPAQPPSRGGWCRARV